MVSHLTNAVFPFILNLSHKPKTTSGRTYELNSNSMQTEQKPQTDEEGQTKRATAPKSHHRSHHRNQTYFLSLTDGLKRRQFGASTRGKFNRIRAHYSIMLQIMALSSAFTCSYQTLRKVSVATTTHPPTFYLQSYLIGRRERPLLIISAVP